MKLSECWVGRVVTGNNFSIGHIKGFCTNVYGELEVVVKTSSSEICSRVENLFPYELMEKDE